MPEPAVTEQDLWSDVQPLLDQELSRLPEKYRTVIVLCELEGKTKREAARQLGLPEGTVASRVARARTMLAKRLARHGPAVSGGALAAWLTENVASAGVPTSVVSSTIKAASLPAAGAISVKVGALTEGVINAMMITKLKKAGAALLLMLVIAALGGGLSVLQTKAAQKEGEKPTNHQVASQAEEAKPADLPEKATARQPGLRMTLDGHHAPVTSLAYSRDGKTLASGSYDNTIKLWDVKTGKERATLKGHTNAVLSVAYSPDGKTLASGSMDRTIKLWDVKTGKELTTLEGHAASVHSVAYSPDGKTLASCGDNIKLWDMKTGTESATLKGHTASVHSLAYSPDGKTLASGSGDRTVRLWDVTTGKERATLKASATSLVYSPDGKTLASCGDNIKLWDVKTGKELDTLEEMWDVDSVAYSPDGKTLALGSHLMIYLWNVATGKQLLSLKGDHTPTYTVAYSPDGKTLASGGKDRTIKLWDVQPLNTGNPVKHPDVAPKEAVSGQLKPPDATFTRVAGPGWLTIKPDGGFTGKPEESDSGVNTWVVSVTRGDGAPTFIELQIKVIGTSIFAENFNGYRGDQNAVQWQSGQKVAHSGRVTGWTKAGEHSMHAVDRANRAGQSNPPNWAVMIFQDNVITSGAIAANASGQVYRIDFEASPAVYAATHPQQATQAGDELLIEVLRGDDRVLASHKQSPGAWTGIPQFAAGSFRYTGDGSGDVHLRIKPAGQRASGRFHGAIDNIIVRKDEGKK
jgi:WD40 repeat protein